MKTRRRGKHAIAFFLALAVTAPLGLGSCGGTDGPSGPPPSSDPPPSDPPAQPSFDPDGSLVAYRREATGRQDIWLANLEQLLARNLTNHPAPDSDPAWSPDGSKLAFVSQRAGAGTSELFVINADGTGLTQVTSNQGNVRFPDWSPDGSMIAYSANVGGQRDIYVIAAPGASQSLFALYPSLANGAIQVTDNAETDNEPVWTPNGAGFYFFSSRNNCSGIYHTTFEGTTTENKVVKLSIDLAFDCNDFMCAPGKGYSVIAGRHVVTFVSDKGGTDDIWVAEVDPNDPSKLSNPRNVTKSQADDFYSTFAQPVPNLSVASDPTAGFAASTAADQARIFFDSNRTGGWHLYFVNEDGTDTRRLTSAAAHHRMPRFRPAKGSSSLQAPSRMASLHGAAGAMDGLLIDLDPPEATQAASPMPLYDMAEGAVLGRRSCEGNDF